MSATKAEQIVDLVVTTLSAVDGTGAYDTDLRDVVMLHSYPAGLEAYTRSQYAAIDARHAEGLQVERRLAGPTTADDQQRAHADPAVRRPATRISAALR